MTIERRHVVAFIRSHAGEQRALDAERALPAWIDPVRDAPLLLRFDVGAGDLVKFIAGRGATVDPRATQGRDRVESG